jgi:hypothetical protein
MRMYDLTRFDVEFLGTAVDISYFEFRERTKICVLITLHKVYTLDVFRDHA